MANHLRLKTITETLAVQPRQLFAPGSVARWVAESRAGRNSQVAVLEIAGRDSIAAGVQAFENGTATHFVPTVVFNGGTRGCPADLEFALGVLEAHVPPDAIGEPVLVGDPGFWEALTVRNLDVMIRHFGVYPGVIACHLYVHLVQVPLCRQLQVERIITGERERHDGEVKLSQTPEVLDTYVEALGDSGIALTQPLRSVESGAAVEAMLAPELWAGGERQLCCVLSGGYRRANGEVSYGPGRDYSPEGNRRYLRQFAVPFAIEYIRRVCASEDVDVARLSAEYSERCDVGSK